MRRVADRDDAGRVARAGAEERRAGDVDHLDRLVDADVAATDLGRERLDVDDDEVEQLEAVVGELVELLGDVAAGEDAGVDRRMERPDLAADERRHLGQVGDGGDLDPVRGEVLAGPVGREHLDARAAASSRAKAEMPSRLATESSARTCSVPPPAFGSGAPFGARIGRWIRAAPGGHVGRRVYRGAVAYSGGPTRRRSGRLVHRATPRRPAHVRHWPWEYLFKPFNDVQLPGPVHAS